MRDSRTDLVHCEGSLALDQYYKFQMDPCNSCLISPQCPLEQQGSCFAWQLSSQVFSDAQGHGSCQDMHTSVELRCMAASSSNQLVQYLAVQSLISISSSSRLRPRPRGAPKSESASPYRIHASSLPFLGHPMLAREHTMAMCSRPCPFLLPCLF